MEDYFGRTGDLLGDIVAIWLMERAADETTPFEVFIINEATISELLKNNIIGHLQAKIARELNGKMFEMLSINKDEDENE